MTVGLVLNLVRAAGEEIGWRGYMLTRFIEAGIPRPVLTHAIVWGLWHLPLILFGLIYTEHPVTIVAALGRHGDGPPRGGRPDRRGAGAL